MRSRLAKVFLVFFALSTSACHPSMHTPDIKHNPHPKMRYELTLTIQGAPGPFESVEGYMQYEVDDKRCSPENPRSGTWNPPFKDVPIEFRRVADNIYSGTLYLDLLMDEDYFGLGVCHWKVVGVTTQMKAYGATFSSHISSDRITLQQSATGYFPKKTYEPTATKDMAFAGASFSEWVSKHRDNFFSTTLTARKQFE